MKTTVLLLTALWFGGGLYAQENPEVKGGKKKVTIVSTWTDEEGRVYKETIIKEGEADQDMQDWYDSDRTEAPEDAVISREVEIRVTERLESIGKTPWETLSEDFRRGLPDVGRSLQDAAAELETMGRDLERTLSGPAFLGVVTEPHEQGTRILEVVDDSPAARAGLQPGDILLRLGDQALRSQQDLIRALRPYRPGDQVTIRWLRDGKEWNAETVLDQRRGGSATRRVGPLDREERILLFRGSQASGNQSAWLGIGMEDHREGIRINQVMRNSPARAVGLIPGDILYRIDRRTLSTPEDLARYLRDKREGDRVILHLRREGRKLEVPVILGDRRGCCLPADGSPGFGDVGYGEREEIRIERHDHPVPPPPGDLELPDLRIFPNPTGGQVRVAFRTPSEEGFTLRLLDPLGKELLLRELEGIDRFDEELDLRDYPSGNYSLIIEHGGRYLSRTIIRNR